MPLSEIRPKETSLEIRMRSLEPHKKIHTPLLSLVERDPTAARTKNSIDFVAVNYREDLSINIAFL